MSRPPTSLPPSGDAPLQVSLLLGSFVHEPLKEHLFDLSVPASMPPQKHPDEEAYHVRPELHHTFRPEPKLPPRIISAIFAGFVLSPWLALLTLVGLGLRRPYLCSYASLALQLSKVPHRLPYLSSPQVLAFVALLAAFEGLLLWYWIALRLGQVLAYGAALGVVTIFAGKSALYSLAQSRVDGLSK